MNTTNENTVAETILSQMGGARRIAAMTGVKQFLASKDGVQFKFAQPVAAKGNCVVIKLAADDTYTVKFYKIRGAKFTVVAEHEGVYCDMLKGMFERQTGLYLSL